MLLGFLNCFGGYALKVEAARGSLALANRMGSFPFGSDGRRRSADAELWRHCWPDVAKGNGGEVGSGSTELAEVLALLTGEPFTVWTGHRPSRFLTKMRLKLGKLEIAGGNSNESSEYLWRCD